MQICLAGGLGNQLFQYAAGISLAKREDVIELELGFGNANLPLKQIPDVCDFELPLVAGLLSKNKSWTRRKFFNLTLRVSTYKKLERRTAHSILIQFFQFFIKKYFWKGFALVSPSGTGFDDQLVISEGDSILVGYFQSYRWLEESKKDNVLKTIKLKNRNSLHDEWKDRASIERPIIVQIRLGDYLNETKFGRLPESYFNRGIELLLTKTKLENIWLFSDNESDAISFISEKYLSKTRVIPSHSYNASSTLEIMRYGHAYVISNSTFGWWGAYLSYYAGSPVIFPDPWFSKMESPKDLTPPHWLGLKHDW